MSETVLMPKLGLTMESGVIVGWIKNEGDTVNKGDILLEVESDKSTVEVECDFEGVLLKHLYVAGDEVECGKPIAIVGAEGEESSGNLDTGSEFIAKQATTSFDTAGGLDEGARRRGRIIASPRARRYAKQHGVDLSTITHGSGSNNRIEERDVKRHWVITR